MKRYEVIAVAVGTVLVISQVILIKDVLSVKEDVAAVKDRVDDLEQVVTYKSAAVHLNPKDKECLARNVFYEAGNQPAAGKIAVAQVTLNRLKDGRWGRHVCDVVYSHAQFSWTLDHRKKWKQPKGELWQESLAAVANIQQGVRIKGLEHSLTYHADYIPKPYWAKSQQPVKIIGQHIFYQSVDNQTI